MATDFRWDSPPLSPDDQALVEAYVQTGRALDDLAYTPEFDALVSRLGKANTMEEKHAIYRRLLYLRKRGRLPRLPSITP